MWKQYLHVLTEFYWNKKQSDWQKRIKNVQKSMKTIEKNDQNLIKKSAMCVCVCVCVCESINFNRFFKIKKNTIVHFAHTLQRCYP